MPRRDFARQNDPHPTGQPPKASHRLALCRVQNVVNLDTIVRRRQWAAIAEVHISMLVFVDESGDPGMKLDRAASRFFVVTAVLFEDHDEATACDQKINHIRKELGFPERTEFHFNSSRRAVREHFLQQVAPYEFFYFSVVLNKAKLFGPGFQFKASFYKYTVNLVFQNAKPHLRDATVVIDRSGGEEFRRQLAKYLTKRINLKDGPSIIRKVKTERSHSNNLLQLADMVCGAVARSFRTDKADHAFYRRFIRHRELSVQVWPR